MSDIRSGYWADRMEAAYRGDRKLVVTHEEFEELQVLDEEEQIEILSVLLRRGFNVPDTLIEVVIA